jgi:hypothetical protein
VTAIDGGGFTPIHGPSALTRYTDSALSNPHGVVYTAVLTLYHDGDGTAPRRVRVSLASFGSGASLTRLWDGSMLIDGVATHVVNTPTARRAVLREPTVPKTAPQQLRRDVFVPGLLSVPQALIAESY